MVLLRCPPIDLRHLQNGLSSISACHDYNQWQAELQRGNTKAQAPNPQRRRFSRPAAQVVNIIDLTKSNGRSIEPNAA